MNGAKAIVAAAMEVQKTNLVRENRCLEGIPKPDITGCRKEKEGRDPET
jgi:hypothetical protein